MTHDELEQVIREGRETRRVEFKASMPWGEERTVAKVVKAALAFANTEGGGVIVFGLGEVPGKRGHYALSGVTEADAASFELDAVAARVNSHASPPIDLVVEHLTLESRRVVAVTIREFTDCPVMCAKSIQLEGEKIPSVRRGSIYCRSRRLPETTEIQTTQDLREIVALASEKQLIRYLRVRAQEPAPGPTDDERFLFQLGGWAT